MLRWTCRLRDAFEERGFLSSNADSSTLSQIKEAEFVDVPNEAYPREFRWETFCSCFKPRSSNRNSVINLVYPDVDVAERQGLVSVINIDTPTSRSIRDMNGLAVNDLGQRSIDVLWLSPTVFISGVAFYIANQMINDYEVTFKGISCCITQLQAFDRVEFDEHSPLPIDFFRHLAPCEHESVWVNRNHSHPNRLPGNCIVRLMTVLPSKARIFLDGRLNIDELRVVLSFPFPPNVTLSFGFDPFDDSVSLDALMELLKAATDLRHIELPEQVFRPHWELTRDTLHVTVESPTLSMTYGYFGSPTPGLLDAISTIHGAGDVTDLRLDVRGMWEGGGLEIVKSVVHRFLDGRLKLENLRIQLSDNNSDDPEPNDIHKVMRELASAFVCRSKDLCHFDVSLYWYAWDLDTDDPDAKWIKRNMHKIRQWDEAIFPQLALNQCNKQLTKALDRRMLPRAIAAINRGILYRKATDHIPYDMSTANASVIFDHIKTDAVKAGQN
jgi:hypothetical protein